ncbi:hypothetical protein A9Q86_13855 [Flavobacteriales bacterium 33_180_T64]|nr:hypothetical protein A9Q86_13855 [Flavobacteriales bacterium 33_180_T64]
MVSQNHKTPLENYKSLTKNEKVDSYEKKKILDSLIHGREDRVDQDKLAQIYHELLRSFYKKNIDFSIDYALKIKAISQSVDIIKNDFYLKNDKNLVYFYYKKGMYHKSVFHGQEFLKKYPIETVKQAVVYRVLGNSYNELGDFNEAISHYNKAIFIFKEHQEIKEEGRTLINLLRTHVEIDNGLFKEDVFELLKRFDEISKECQFSKNEILKKELNAGVFYDNIEDYKKAKIRYTKSLELSKELSDSLSICQSLINLGIVNRKEHEFKESRRLFNSAIPYTKYNSEKKASLYNNLADLYKEEKNYEQALIYYNNAITEFLQIKKTNVFDVLSIEAFNLIENKVDLLGYIIDKANLLLLIAEDEEQGKYLQLALKLYALSDQIVDVIYFESREDFSKLFWRKEASNFYLNATEIAYQLNDPKKAFYYIEKSKALLLLENITNSKAKTLAKLPGNLIDREYNLLSEIKKTEDKLSYSKPFTVNKLLVDSLKNEIFSKKQKYTHFIDSLEIAYPSYYSYKKRIMVFDSKMVQESLKANEIVLQYKFNSNKGFVVLITKSSEEIFRLENITQIHEILDQYIDLVSKPFVDHKDQQYFKTISNKLYLNLLPFLKNNKDFYINKKVIIIPDTRLHYIPFESLVTSKKLDLTESYLLNFCDISYAYSYSSLRVSYDEKFKKDFFAISPVSFKDLSLSSLFVTEKDIANIEAILNVNIVSEEDATKQRFLNEYGTSKVVHISTHGGVLNNKPWISFNDEKLMLSDIYFKNKKANLVVLSACKTSHGEIKKGEGVMSIARAFINSGSRSVVSSLWDINQQSTNEIISTFYLNLKEGCSKSKALRKAKIAYIKNHKNTSEASPFYWSSLVLTGDTESVFDNYENIWYILIAIMVFVAIIFIAFKVKRGKI